MLNIYHSNKLDLLKDLVVKLMTIEQPSSDPLSPEIILIPSAGMAQWLQMELAKSLDIAANINCILPATFIWNLSTKILPDLPDENSFTKSSMTWQLMHRLPILLKKKEFILLKQYFNNDCDKRKLYQFSTRIADLFDQYLVYRPDWIIHWEHNELIENLGQQQIWQAALWRDLVSFTKTQGDSIWHRANVYANVMQALKQNNFNQELYFPKRIFIFGLSSLPPIYLQVFQELHSYINIHFFFNNPCRYYWGDIEDYAFLAKLENRQQQKVYLNQISTLSLTRHYSEYRAPILTQNVTEQYHTNPLLASWGKIGRDTLFLLSQIESSNDIEAFVDIPKDNLLHIIQSDILNLEDNTVIGLHQFELTDSSKKRLLSLNDRSIIFHACHSERREVEILHDHILSLMEADTELKLREIIVMVNDIDKYSPIIQSVFASVPFQRYLPFVISNRPTLKWHPIVVAFLNLLKLPESRFTAEEILSFLELPDLAERFFIDDNSLNLLRRWIIESGIRWGIDDSNLEDLCMPITGQHTWKFGLKRMLLGYALESCYGDWQGILPYDECNGLMAEIVGYLAEFLSHLNSWRKLLSQLRTLEEWEPIFAQLIDTFFVINSKNEISVRLVEKHWKELLRQGINANYNQSIPISLLREELYLRLDKQPMNQHFLHGSINFCALMPMRAIPFKVVCLLGMQDNVYPRTILPVAFDLMNKQIRKGDRNRRYDDYYLFLEALIAAQYQFYISYIGFTIQDNTECEPCIMVRELLDYISQSFCLYHDEKYMPDITAERIRRHLQICNRPTPFCKENFEEGKYGQSFAEEWLPAAIGGDLKNRKFLQSLKPQKIKSISVQELINFWYHPVRTWFQKRLGVFFPLEKKQLPDNEPFSLNYFERYQMNYQLLNTLVMDKDIKLLYKYYRNTGFLPYGAFGDFFWQSQLKTMNDVAMDVKAQYQTPTNHEIDLNICNIHVTGWLNQVQMNGLLRWRPTILKMSDALELWLEHLLYCAMGGKGDSRMYGLKKSKWYFKSISPQQSQLLLEDYLKGYQVGLTRPLMLINKAGHVWLDSVFDIKSGRILEDKKTKKIAFNKFLKTWHGNAMQIGEKHDPYLYRLIPLMNKDIAKIVINTTRKWYLPVRLAHKNDL